MDVNKAWLYLIFMGVAALLAAVGWEIYQYVTDGRTEFTYTVNELPSNQILSPEVEEHILTDPND